MSQTRLRGHRRWWILAAILIVGVIAAVPVASVIHHMFDNAVGRTTVAKNAGFDAPAIDGLESWSAEDRIRDLGGLTPDQQVIVSGVALGRAGQWLAFRFQDLSKDAKGNFTERLRPPEGAQWQMNTMALSYGANGLLAAEDRNEFESRMESFHGLIPPAPLES